MWQSLVCFSLVRFLLMNFQLCDQCRDAIPLGHSGSDEPCESGGGFRAWKWTGIKERNETGGSLYKQAVTDMVNS